MVQTRKSKRVKDLEKRLDRLETEVLTAEAKIEDQIAAIKKKKDEIKAVQADLISELLVVNDMTMGQLTTLLMQDSGTTSINSNSTNHQN